MEAEESVNKIFIKNEFSFLSNSPLTGIVYVQPDEKYYIKCNQCEQSFELIQNFTRHCIETHNCFLELPAIGNISGNCPDLQEFQEDNLSATNIPSFYKSNDSNYNNDFAVKTENHETWKIPEVQLNTNFDSQSKNFDNKNIQNDDDYDDGDEMEGCQLNNKKRTTENFKNLKCEICQKQLMSRSGFLRHIKRGKCEIQIKVENSSFKCTICGKEFAQKRFLKSHELTHQTDIILTCKHCKTEFKGKKNFLAHLKTHSEQGKPHSCEICSKKFSTKYKLKCHSISVHSSEPFYKCNQCSEAFRSNHKLREHKSDVHNGPPKHKCQYCPKSFLRLCDLQVHERVHTGEKPYQCEVCGRSFAAIHLLTNHNKRHTNERNFKCDICGKCFFTAVYLRDHMITHTKIKSFSCEICNTRFTLRTALLKHRKLHSGIKEYVCKLCGKAYAQSPGLYAHMKTHKLAQESNIQ